MLNRNIHVAGNFNDRSINHDITAIPLQEMSTQGDCVVDSKQKSCNSQTCSNKKLNLKITAHNLNYI